MCGLASLVYSSFHLFFKGKSFFIADSYKNQPNIKKSLKVRVDYIGPLIACAKGRIVDSCEEAEVVMIGDEDKG